MTFHNTHYNLIDTLKHYDPDKWYFAQRIVARSDNKEHTSSNVVRLSSEMFDTGEQPSMPIVSIFIEAALWSYHNGKYGWAK